MVLFPLQFINNLQNKNFEKQWNSKEKNQVSNTNGKTNGLPLPSLVNKLNMLQNYSQALTYNFSSIQLQLKHKPPYNSEEKYRTSDGYQ